MCPVCCSGDMSVDNVCIVSRSPCGLERMMAAFVEVFGTFSPTISDCNTETVCSSILCAPATQIVSAFSGGVVTETPTLSAEIDRWIRAG